MNTNTKAHLYAFVTLFGGGGAVAGYATGISWIYDHYGTGPAVIVGFVLPVMAIFYAFAYVLYYTDIAHKERLAEIAALPPLPELKLSDAHDKPENFTKRKLVPTNLVKPPKRKTTKRITQRTVKKD
jgi:hypothetical protein